MTPLALLRASARARDLQRHLDATRAQVRILNEALVQAGRSRFADLPRLMEALNERDRARDTAVALEQEDAHLLALLAHAASTGCACTPDCTWCWDITQALKEAK